MFEEREVVDHPLAETETRIHRDPGCIDAGLTARGVRAIAGNGAAVLAAANLKQARTLFVALPDSFEAGQIVAQARALNTGLEIIAWSHSDAEANHLTDYGANEVILGADEIAAAMVDRFLAA